MSILVIRVMVFSDLDWGPPYVGKLGYGDFGEQPVESCSY